MSRYIDADALKNKITELDGGCAVDGIGFDIYTCEVFELIDEVPTADVVEVKHGKNICDTVIGHCEFKCSICGADALSVSCGSLDGGNFNYCPNCGADMRGGSNDGR